MSPRDEMLLLSVPWYPAMPYRVIPLPYHVIPLPYHAMLMMIQGRWHATKGRTLPCIAWHCNAVQFNASSFYAMRSNVTHCNSIHCNTVIIVMSCLVTSLRVTPSLDNSRQVTSSHATSRYVTWRTLPTQNMDYHEISVARCAIGSLHASIKMHFSQNICGLFFISFLWTFPFAK